MSVVSLGKQISKKLAKKLEPEQIPLNRGQRSIQRATEGQTVTENLGRRKKRRGQIEGGAIIGGTALLAEGARQSMDSDSPVASNADSNLDTRINPADFPTYKKNTKSAKAFRDAFAKAVEDGDKTFTFEGREYNTRKLVRQLDVDRPPPPKPKAKPTKKAMGGMIGKKPRVGNMDYRKGGMVYSTKVKKG